eukprot:NODE_205_length_14851_cov_0.317584.p8 type:complete len:137 gc:universal NODE_205_length_14851_cov_0.317584:6889-6479(-)
MSTDDGINSEYRFLLTSISEYSRCNLLVYSYPQYSFNWLTIHCSCSFIEVLNNNLLHNPFEYTLWNMSLSLMYLNSISTCCSSCLTSWCFDFRIKSACFANSSGMLGILFRQSVNALSKEAIHPGSLLKHSIKVMK